jgi:hypothetical protein
MQLNPVHFERLQLTTRRQFLNSAGHFSLGAIALHALNAEAAPTVNPQAPRHPHHPAKAKRVIYLSMSGGPPCPDSFLAGRTFAFTSGVPKLMGSPRTFKQYGQGGLWMSTPAQTSTRSPMRCASSTR